ncbi:pyrroline-5-carboxylate reductase [Deinococcus sp. KNUC1210]|uniref:pyrroline-5-carboxylate reductase n=1 Tax=Deinococcus sp. KNUC1210 TaxID=2917691 RepID=UPI001EEFDCB9|nr:pyrroline-5-carboxylate reductase [Deinococcus sp. KNUC1210]ULH16407.1 pyrroline-5-carboxylate reductase [Deinococcus sp. KNUC1210]
MKLAIVGVGKLGLSLLEGILRRGVLQPQEIGLLDANTERTEALSERFGVQVLDERQLGNAPHVLLSVQPRILPDISEWLSAPLPGGEGRGYISTLAGVSTETLSRRLHTRRVVRVMPNLAATIGQAQTAMTAPPEAHTAGDVAFAHELFGAVGQVYELSEHLMHVFTGMSASGPAYLAVVAESLADGGVRMGLPRALAQELAARLLSASGDLLLSRAHPGMLKDEVASPGGTTIAGIEALEKAGVRGGLISAVVAATQRSMELGKDQE